VIRFLLLTLVVFSVNANEKLITLDSRQAVTQQILIEQPNNPKANLILFAGGKGKIKLKSGRYENNKNFLVRSRQLFVNQGFTIILVDAPSDKQGKLGMLKGFRNSQEHVQDIESVINYVKSLNNNPVWLIGTSRGTESVAYVAVNLNDQIDGVVLTSSISKTNNKGTSVTDLALERITVPVLAIHHKQDKCKVTKPRVVEDIKRKSYNASRVEIKLFNGGDKPISGNPCQAMTYHGYLGIEKDVIKYISNFIN